MREGFNFDVVDPSLIVKNVAKINKFQFDLFYGGFYIDDLPINVFTEVFKLMKGKYRMKVTEEKGYTDNSYYFRIDIQFRSHYIYIDSQKFTQLQFEAYKGFTQNKAVSQPKQKALSTSNQKRLK